MKKRMTLSEDGFIRATQIKELLSEGWKISLVDTDPTEVYLEKENIDESVPSGPKLLLD